MHPSVEEPSMSSGTQTVRKAIQERRRTSGLGVGCTEAQADGVPCPDLNRDCDRCDRAAEAEAREKAERLKG
jgi:hypothetical protein